MGLRILQNCENQVPLKSKMAASLQIHQPLNRYDSTADFAISLKFGAKFEHMTSGALQSYERSRSKQRVQGQRVEGQGRSVTWRIGSKNHISQGQIG